jgi:protein-L-isoaspartate(D-aspartate) O-methyltransferase
MKYNGLPCFCAQDVGLQHRIIMDMANSVLQRTNMVESQVRPSDVTDRRITQAMQLIARELYLPASAAQLAYMDEDLPVAAGRSAMSPRSFARLLQLAEVEAEDNVLIVGCLYGYSAVVIAQMAAKVTALDVDAAAVSAADRALAEAQVKNVAVVRGPLEVGWPANAPYHVIFVEGAVDRLPTELVDQLQTGGRLVAIEADAKVGHAVVLQKTVSAGRTSVSKRIAFDASAPRLPGFEIPKAFVF